MEEMSTWYVVIGWQMFFTTSGYRNVETCAFATLEAAQTYFSDHSMFGRAESWHHFTYEIGELRVPAWDARLNTAVTGILWEGPWRDVVAIEAETAEEAQEAGENIRRLEQLKREQEKQAKLPKLITREAMVLKGELGIAGYDDGSLELNDETLDDRIVSHFLNHWPEEGYFVIGKVRITVELLDEPDEDSAGER